MVVYSYLLKNGKVSNQRFHSKDDVNQFLSEWIYVEAKDLNQERIVRYLKNVCPACLSDLDKWNLCTKYWCLDIRTYVANRNVHRRNYPLPNLETISE